MLRYIFVFYIWLQNILLMRKILLAMLLAVAIVAPGQMSAKKAKDPVVMTVGNRDVRLSEFEYLYKKNNEQQQDSTTLDDYVDMFVNYKRKVLAAEAAGLDTLSEMVAEYNRYRAELAAPYMRVQSVDDSLKRVAYSHFLENVSVNHIIVAPQTATRTRKQQWALLDSLRGLLKNGADFGELAARYSADPAAKSTKGAMGCVPVGVFPYEFEDMAYRTPVGDVSPVFETMFGLHILQVSGRRPDIGRVKARHILKVTNGLDSDAADKKRAEADSLYRLLLSGADFKKIASEETEDPSGKNNGGDLPWFGAGRMVPEFEEAAFSLSDGEISKPVRTSYGYHIILREGYKKCDSYESMEKELGDMIARDSRGGLSHRRKLDEGRRRWKVTPVVKAEKLVTSVFKENGGWNENAKSVLSDMNSVVVKSRIGDVKIADVVKEMPAADISDVESAETAYKAAVNRIVDNMVESAFLAVLPDEEASYRNLLNEYRDGMLLYEISNREVWNKANTDLDGLQEYFEQHRSDYVWDRPHYRGYVLAAVSDSVADAALSFLNGTDIEDSALTAELRKKFGTNAKLEKVITAQGATKIVDYIGFGGARPEAGERGRWVAYRPYKGEILQQPQSAMDVKSQVSMAYQKYLEAQWLERLKLAYPEKLNRAVLSAIK